MRLSGWGNFPAHDTVLLTPRDPAALVGALAQGRLIARGNGRAYGDSAVGVRTTAHMARLDRMLAFDPANGRLVAESGVMLADIVDSFVPRGWFPYVTPGTRHVTLGGMIAADVHGKNHHKEGSLRHYIDWIDLLLADGRTLRCSPDDHGDLFAWTIGGMGLTGIILRAAIRLRPIESGWMVQHGIATRDLDETIAAFDAHGDATYSVAWIDTLARGTALGRSILMLGEHARRDDLNAAQHGRPFDAPPSRHIAMPFTPPVSLLSPLAVRLFNAAYHRQGRRRAGRSLVPLLSYFYPLDAIAGWNRIYGRRGFMQFQCVLPTASSAAGLRTLIARIAERGAGSFLAVLKKMGPEGGGLSFPMEGHTLAVDFPVTARSIALMAELEAIAIDHGGRFYLAKDSRLGEEAIRRADPRVERFAAWRRAQGLDRVFASHQSERLKL